MKINKTFLFLILISYYFRGISTENQSQENISDDKESHHHHEQKIPFGSPEFFLQKVIVVFAGMMSGLTVGYSSIDPLHLEILQINGSDEQKKQASKIEPIIEKKHLMLATLLLSNALAMESLPIFLDAIMPATLAIILSTTIVLIFGEVVPQALCLGENQIQIAAQLSPFISCLIKILYPICYPISLALDYFLGHGEGKVRFKKKDLKAIIELHQIKQNPANEGFTADEINIINSVIDIRNVNVEQIMVPLSNAFKVYEDEIITKDLIKRIQDKNFSRIPVFSRKNYCLGFMKTKTVLIVMQNNLGQQINTLQRTNKVQFIARNTNLLEAIEIMHRENMSLLLIATDVVNLGVSRIQRSRNNMKVGIKDMSGILGLVFLKDIFEELIKREIDDEDLHYDSRAQHYGRPNTQVPRIDMSEPQEMKEYEKEPLLQNEYDQILFINFFKVFYYNIQIIKFQTLINFSFFVSLSFQNKCSKYSSLTFFKLFINFFFTKNYAIGLSSVFYSQFQLSEPSQDQNLYKVLSIPLNFNNILLFQIPPINGVSCNSASKKSQSSSLQFKSSSISVSSTETPFSNSSNGFIISAAPSYYSIQQESTQVFFRAKLSIPSNAEFKHHLTKF